MTRLAVTTGEPAGIGPDVCVTLGESFDPDRIALIGDAELLAARAAALGSPAPENVIHVPLQAPVTPGVLDPRNAAYVLATLRRAVRGCCAGEFEAMVTGPVHKGVINDAGFPFTGHTEFLAVESGVREVAMMLVGGGLRVALATTHLALRDVPAAIDREGLERILRILHEALRADFGLGRPRIVVAGLNPHAGESGHLGREEIEVIAPVVDRLRGEGMDVAGPFPADTLFAGLRDRPADAVLAMYHDQGLAVLKYASFGEGVNVTLGLPFVRTSVDHGTAVELAGTGRASPGSLLAALRLAVELSRNRRAFRGMSI